MHLKEDSDYKALLPRLNPEEYEALKESIKAEGQHLPIVVNSNNVILDGYTRYDICKELQIVPKTMVKDFDNKLLEKKFVIISNLQRRHLTTNQKAALAYKLLPIEKELAEERKLSTLKKGDELPIHEISCIGEAMDLAGKQAGISGDTLRQYKIIQEKGTEELKEKVAKSEIPIYKAKEIIDSTTEEYRLKELKKENEATVNYINRVNQYRKFTNIDALVKMFEDFIKGLDKEIALMGKEDLPLAVEHIREMYFKIYNYMNELKEYNEENKDHSEKYLVF